MRKLSLGYKEGRRTPRGPLPPKWAEQVVKKQGVFQKPKQWDNFSKHRS